MRERHQTMRLAAAESLKENHRYTTGNKISMCPPLVFVEARETLLVHPDGLSVQEWRGGTPLERWAAAFSFLFIEM